MPENRGVMMNIVYVEEVSSAIILSAFNKMIMSFTATSLSSVNLQANNESLNEELITVNTSGC